MQRNLDTIKFENKREIEAIRAALLEYLKRHPSDKNTSSVSELYDKLDVMHMTW